MRQLSSIGWSPLSGSKIACGAADLISWAGISPSPGGAAVLERRAQAASCAPCPSPTTRRRCATRSTGVLAPAILDWRQRLRPIGSARRRSGWLARRPHGARRGADRARTRGRRACLHRWLVGLGMMSCVAGAGWLYMRPGECVRRPTRRRRSRSRTRLSIPEVRWPGAGGGGGATVPSWMSVARAGPPAPDPDRCRRRRLAPGDPGLAPGVDPAGERQGALRCGFRVPMAAGCSLPARIRPRAGVGYPQRPSRRARRHLRARRLGAAGPLPADGERVITVSGGLAYLWSLAQPTAPLRSFEHGGNISAFDTSADGTAPRDRRGWRAEGA